MNQIVANGKPVEAQLPCSIEEFLVAQKVLPHSCAVTNVTLAVAGTRS